MRNVIRKYEDSDRDNVLSIWEKASSIAHPFLTEEFLQTERHAIVAIILPNTETWIVEDDHHCVGFISLFGVEVGLLFVHPEFQHVGAGRALLDMARKGRGDLEVEVFTANSAGCTFYLKYGFVVVCEKLHAPTGNAMLRMRLPSAPLAAIVR